MKLVSASIENFRGIRHLEIPVREDWTGAPRPLTVLVGDNGSGKTSALQALALTLGLATRRLRSPDRLEWYGFLPERLGSQGSTRVVARVRMSTDEIRNAGELYDVWRPLQADSKIPPPDTHTELEIVYADGRVTCSQGLPGLVQLWGRFFIKTVLTARPDLRDRFARSGDVFWFDQYRSLASAANVEDDGKPGPAWKAGVDALRADLLKWWGYHARPDRRPENDWTARLQDMVAAVFPGTRFLGPEPVGEGSDQMWFLLEREGNRFDLAELSSGEQAAFALMHKFAFQAIHHSVVLVDEVELHLHPGTQQAFVRWLRKVAPDCQWLVTTHSQHVADAFSDDVVRLEGGTPCL